MTIKLGSGVKIGIVESQRGWFVNCLLIITIAVIDLANERERKP